MKCLKKSKVVKEANLGKEWLPKSLSYQKISQENLQNLKLHSIYQSLVSKEIHHPKCTQIWV